MLPLSPSWLGVNWRPTAEAGALTVLERCAAPLDAAYLLGVAYYLEQAGRIPILLQRHAVEGQAERLRPGAGVDYQTPTG